MNHNAKSGSSEVLSYIRTRDITPKLYKADRATFDQMFEPNF